MALGAGNGTLTTTEQKVAESGEPVTLLCTAEMVMMNASGAASGLQWTWPANTPYPTDGTTDVWAKVASGTAPFQRAKS